LKDEVADLSLLNVIQRWITEPPPDKVFELTDISVAAASPRAPGAPHQQMLGEPSLQISPVGPNVLKPQIFEEAIAKLAPVDRNRRNTAALVVPDYAVRMSVLDFEELPSREEERTALVRFRLRKSVPFPIDEAQVSYSIQLNEKDRSEVLAVAIARPILEEYEALVKTVGFTVGLVTPSCVAALPLCPSTEPGLTLFAKAAGSTLTVVLLDQRRVRLVRCLDLANAETDSAEAEDTSVLALVQQTLAFAEDQLALPVKHALLCGFGAETDSLGSLLASEFGLSYALVRSRFGAASQENAGVLGLLEQYAA
jgi:type IV pilus assembly protein PilM